MQSQQQQQERQQVNSHLVRVGLLLYFNCQEVFSALWQNFQNFYTDNSLSLFL